MSAEDLKFRKLGRILPSASAASTIREKLTRSLKTDRGVGRSTGRCRAEQKTIRVESTNAARQRREETTCVLVPAKSKTLASW